MIVHPATMTKNVPARDERTRYGIVDGDGQRYLTPVLQYQNKHHWTDSPRLARTWATEDDPHMLAKLRCIQREEDTAACIVVFHR